MTNPEATQAHRNGATDPSKTVRIALLFHSTTSGNLGVGALTLANIAIIERAALDCGVSVEFVIVGMRDGDTPDYGVADYDRVHLNKYSFVPGSAVWKAIEGADLAFDISGGDSFSDIYGMKRFSYIMLLKMICHVYGKPLTLSPMTIGPFYKKTAKVAAAFTMNRARAVFARDEVSFDVARDVAGKADVHRAIDVAFALPFEKVEQSDTGAINVGLNVSGLLYGDARKGKNRFNLSFNYKEFCDTLIEELQGRGCKVHLIAHANSKTLQDDNDAFWIDELASRFPSVVRVEDFRSPIAAKSYIAGLDFLVAARMHACIAAYSAGVPVVPVSYSRKFAGLFGTLNYGHVIPVQGLDTAGAVSFVLDALQNRAVLREDVSAGARRATQMLEGYRSHVRASLADFRQR